MSLYGNDLRVENRYSHILKKWYVKSNDRFINLICEPYQKLNFIESLIGDCLINNEKVLYVGKSRKVCKNEQLNSMNFDFVNFNNIFNIKKNFNLIIYDDVSLYSNKSSIECNEDLMYLKRLSKKIVICSVDKVFNNIKHIEILNNQRKTHFLEPRLITTRVNLETSMPYTLYDYIEWFIREKRILVVYVPNKFNKSKHKQKRQSNVPSWSNTDYVNTTSEETKAELERKKQEMLARLNRSESHEVQTDIYDFLD